MYSIQMKSYRDSLKVHCTALDKLLKLNDLNNYMVPVILYNVHQVLELYLKTRFVQEFPLIDETHISKDENWFLHAHNLQLMCRQFKRDVDDDVEIVEVVVPYIGDYCNLKYPSSKILSVSEDSLMVFRSLADDISLALVLEETMRDIVF